MTGQIDSIDPHAWKTHKNWRKHKNMSYTEMMMPYYIVDCQHPSSSSILIYYGIKPQHTCYIELETAQTPANPICLIKEVWIGITYSILHFALSICKYMCNDMTYALVLISKFWGMISIFTAIQKAFVHTAVIFAILKIVSHTGIQNSTSSTFVNRLQIILNKIFLVYIQCLVFKDAKH